MTTTPARSLRSMPALLAGVLCRLLALGSLVEEELADEVLQHHRGLREAQPVAALQHHAVAAGLQADVLLAEDARSEDLRRGVARELVAGVEVHRHDRLVALVVEADVLDAADHHA